MLPPLFVASTRPAQSARPRQPQQSYQACLHSRPITQLFEAHPCKEQAWAALLGCYGSTQGLSAMGQISLHTAARPAQLDSEKALKYR